MADLPEDMLPRAEQLLSEQGSGEQQLLFKLSHMLMWTKLRPGIRHFLVEAHKLFELHIYTHGDQDYAAEMAKLLDPNKSMFVGRVISAVSIQVPKHHVGSFVVRLLVMNDECCSENLQVLITAPSAAAIRTAMRRRCMPCLRSLVQQCTLLL